MDTLAIFIAFLSVPFQTIFSNETAATFGLQLKPTNTESLQLLSF